MEFLVTYDMDDVGYAEVCTARSAEEAGEAVIRRMKAAYPACTPVLRTVEPSVKADAEPKVSESELEVDEEFDDNDDEGLNDGEENDDDGDEKEEE